MALITWDHAKRELGLSGDDQQIVVMDKAEHATAIVLRRIAGYIERELPVWDDTTDPTTDPVFALVQAAILQQTCALYRERGDDPGRDQQWPTAARYDVDPAVVRILAQIEDPTCA